MTTIAISKISLSGWNPRKNFESEALEELKKSIQEHGILEPLIVRQTVESNNPLDGEFELVAGERRFRAAQELGLKTVPVVIRTLSDRQVREIMLIENLQREGLDPLEEAAALDRLLNFSDCDTTQDGLAKKLGKSQSWIANRLRLLKAPEELKEMIVSREISPKHVMALLPYVEYPVFKEVILPDFQKDIKLGKRISVENLEDSIRNIIQWRAHDQVIQLNDFPCGEQYVSFFDFSKCDSCKDVYTPPLEEDEDNEIDPDEKQEQERYCLNRRCWSDKLNIAKQKAEKERTKKVKKMDGDDTVDIEKLSYKEYERVGKWNSWDKTECQTCKNWKLPLKPEEYSQIEFICLDPACAKAKDAAHRKEELRIAKGEAQKTLEAMDAWIGKFSLINNAEIRGIIKILVQHLWGDSIKQALKPWTSKGGKWNLDEVDKIPDNDLVKALLRLCIVQDLTAHNYHGVNRKVLEKTIAVFEGRPIPKEKLGE